MGWLSNIFKTQEQREDAAARALLQSKIAELETKIKQATESVTLGGINNQYPFTYQRFFDPDRILLPSGDSNDRRYGQNWPILTNEQDLRQMRSLSRLICETNAYAIGFTDHVVNFVVGRGFTWQVSLAGQKRQDVNSDGQDDDPDVQACQKVLDEFRRLNHWGESGVQLPRGETVDDLLSQPTGLMLNRERETYKRAVTDGEALIRLFPGDYNTNGVPLIRAAEPECLRCPPSVDQNGPWSFGILTERDDTETIRAYHLTDPNSFDVQQGEVVPASEVVHLKMNSVSTVKRGIPDFFPITDEVQGSQTLVRNMVKVSGILSAIAYIRQHSPVTTGDQVMRMIQNGAITRPDTATLPPGGVPAGPDATRYLTMHQAGLIIDISDKLQYQPGPVNTGIPGFIQAQQATLRCVGLRWGCPEYFSGDGSNANFASTLVAGGPFERATQTRQDDYRLYQTSLATRVLLFAVKAGRLRLEQVRKVVVNVTAPPVAIANKNEDTARRKLLHDAGVLDLQTWCGEEGYDWPTVLQNRQQESALNRPKPPALTNQQQPTDIQL